ncbi:hypothetical protein [Brucella haematophila]|uniref:hypothetical protein n=1 Tax=Brucella haematophila TaxID=419474 RepID=UPI00110E2334|nr:hypothetical protein [Brucella haematophila]TMV03573.1 hypothetical protein FGI60_10390 [Brucella haematophila]
MRHCILRLVVGPVLAFTTTPVFAETANILDRYKATLETLVGDLANPEAYREKILDGLNGDWFAISELDPNENDPAKLALFCTPSSLGRVAIRVLNPYSFEATTAPASKNPSSTIYTARSENQFGSYTDIQPLIRRLGLTDGDTVPFVEQRMISAILKNSNGVVTVTRPYNDMLLIRFSDNRILILARCLPQDVQ